MSMNVVVFYPKLEALEVQKCHMPHIVIDDVVIHFDTSKELEEFTDKLVKLVYNEECKCYTCTKQTEEQIELTPKEEQVLLLLEQERKDY